MNAGAGNVGDARCAAKAEEVRAAFAEVGVEADVHLGEGADLAATARRVAAGVDAVVAAGGDGTISAIAGALAGGPVPLAVLPLGTLNHFARDIGMPDGLREAAAAIAAGHVDRLDVGEVNGQVFINNSSIGLYPEVVLSREAERRRSGRGKWFAMLIAILRVLRRFPLLSVRVATPHGTVVRKTPFVFLGNNEYTISTPGLGARARLDRGHLSLYTVRCRGRLHLFWVVIRAVLQRLEAVADFEFQLVDQAQIDLHHHTVKVSRDGEVDRMRTPLRYRIRPGALAVVLPPAVAAGTESAA